MKWLGIVLLGLLSATAAAAGPDYYDYGQLAHWQASYQTDETVTNAIEFQRDGRTYWAVTGSSTSLAFYDLASGAAELRGSVGLPGIARDAIIGDPYSYVVSTPNRVAKVLHYDLAHTVSLWSVEIPGAPQDVEPYAGYLVIACGADGLMVFDTSEQFGLVVGVIGTWAQPADEVEILGDYALVRSEFAVSTVYLGDPTTPVLVDSLPLSSGAHLALNGSLAYTISGAQIAEIDATDPAQLEQLRSLPCPSDNYSEGQLIYDGGSLVLARSQRLHVLDLDSGSLVWKSAYFRSLLYPQALVRTGSFLGVAGNDEGLQVFDWRSPADAPGVAVASGVSFTQMKIVGDLLLAYYRDKFYCLRLDTATPQLVMDRPTPDYIDHFAVTNDRVYLGLRSNQVEILEIAGMNCSLRASFTAGGTILSMAALTEAADGHLAVHVVPQLPDHPTRTVEIYDLRDPLAPAVCDSLNIAEIDELNADGSTLAVGMYPDQSFEIRLFDASDPSNLTEVGTIPNPTHDRVVMADHFLYRLDADALRAYDISDPSAPVAGTRLVTPKNNTGKQHLVVDGPTGYLTDFHSVVDLSDPLSPRPMGSTSRSDLPYVHAAAAGAGYTVLSYLGTLAVLPAQGTGPTAVADDLPMRAEIPLDAYPNPFNPKLQIAFEMPSAGEARARLFDVRGRRVAELSRTVTAAGPVRMEWNGLTDAGQAAPSGVYFVKIATPAGEAVRKVVLAR